ncbi:MAG: sodium:proton antiporter [Alphaproteobacteria bacterium 41-28]|nr:MAG: sodium:proton antiporter [Alphaproteobacteria bacterium 41-28]
MRFKYLFLILILLIPSPLLAGGAGLPGHSLSLWWALPFVGMLASLALMPLLAIHFWEAHYGKVALGWSFLTIFSLIGVFGVSLSKTVILGTFFHHYFPFVIMIGALYTIAGGIRIEMESHATPLLNTGLLAVGTFLAGWIGTTGAAMLFIRPLLHINRDREMRVHHMIFFIFLVANIGGALTPLGDPPLFIGFLNGVTFFWPLKNLILPMIAMIIPLLLIFYGLDKFFMMREGLTLRNAWPRIKIKGELNGFLFLGVIGFVLVSGLWKSGFQIHFAGVSLDIQNVIRDVGLMLLAIVSWMFTPHEIHKANHFSWEPLKEVAKLFFGIFMTVIPVIAILDAGLQGAMAPLISMVDIDDHPQNAMYFWLSGGLSSILDNAPTYLVFFHMAGGDATFLMSTLARTLEAISLGAVFMGALTYIGNAPNFIVKAIAESHKIRMPSFFGYLGWSMGILLPLFILLSLWRF